ncbi:MAG: hypothetical protein JWO50_164 [Candidatus Kaiserbacteria bacterium]|nr:hypothetical protein [Candidatus Kaiserbacteria bacterium]
MKNVRAIGLFIAVSFLVPLSAFATTYTPGQTLDPNCSPSDPTCLVVNITITAANINATSTTATSTFAGGFSVGTSSLFVDSISGKVGIGITPPSSSSYILDANGGINASGGAQSTGPRNIGFSIGGGQAVFTNMGNSSNLFVGNSVGANATGSVAYRNTIFGLNSGANIPDVSSGGGFANSFFGYNAGNANTLGAGNVFLGINAGWINTTGGSNTVVGTNAGYLITTGSGNTVIGGSAGGTTGGAITGNSNIIVGSGSSNITSGSNNIMIGNLLNTASSTDNYQMNIQNILYGKNNSGTALTASTGQLGVGTSTPWGRFSIAAAANASIPQFVVASSTAVSFIVDQSGNVGIGTSSPSAGTSLDIFNTSTFGIVMTRFSSSANTGFRRAQGTSGAPTIVSNGQNLGQYFWQGFDGTNYQTAAAMNATVDGTTVSSSSMPGRLVFLTTPSGSTTLSERMRIDSAGNVGIGTASPVGTGSTTLQILGSGGGATQYGSLSLSNSTNGGTSIPGSVDFYGAGTLYNAIRPTLTTGGASGSSDLKFYNLNAGVFNNTATITKDGQFRSTSGFFGGTAGFGLLDESLILQESNTGAGANSQISFRDYLGNNISAIRNVYPGGTNTGSLAFLTNNGGTYAERVRIDSVGNVGIGTSTPTAQLSTTGTVRFSNFGAGTLTTDASGNLSVSSDERLKNIDGSFTRGLSDIMKLSPISYHWNQLSGLDTQNSYSGFSAQNVRSAIPEAVGTTNNGYLTLQDRPILAATVNAIKDIGSIAGGFKDALVSWLGSSSNGLNKVTTDQLCVRDNTGATTCITKSQLDALLSGTGLNGRGTGIGGTPAQVDSTPEPDTSTTTPSENDVTETPVLDSSSTPIQ